MKRSSLVLAAVFTASIAGSVYAADVPAKPVKKTSPPPELPFFLVNDNRLTYAYLFTGTFPGVTNLTSRQTVAFTHFDAWAYGTNFINLGYSKSSHSDPAVPCTPVLAIPTGCAGRTEFYAVARSTFGWNQIFDTKAFNLGPLNNISFEVGADVGTENSYYASDTRKLLAGLQFQFALPYKGYVNVAPLIYQEWTHDGYLQTGSQFVPPGLTGLPDGELNYHPSWALEINYYMDLGFLPAELQYFAISGRAGFYGPGGTGGPGPYSVPASFNTTVQIESEPIRLTFDASKAIWGEKYSHFVDVWVAYRYWKNKFGLDDSNPANFLCYTNGVNNHTCTENSLYSGITVKF
nr:hypothetical protein [Bradyrhizobium sp. WSM3983]